MKVYGTPDRFANGKVWWTTEPSPKSTQQATLVDITEFRFDCKHSKIEFRDMDSETVIGKCTDCDQKMFADWLPGDKTLSKTKTTAQV